MSVAPAPFPENERLYRIGEVSRLAGVQAFVLRYWEAEFPMLQPVKSRNKHRMYRQQDVDLVIKIKRLLYDEGFTIAGARRYLEETAAGCNGNGRSAEVPALVEGPDAHLNRKMLLDLRDSLRSFLTLLERK